MAVNPVILYGVQSFCFLLSFLINIQKKGSRKGQLWHADCSFLLSDAQSSKAVKVCCCFWGSGTSVCMYSKNYLLLNAVTNALWLLGWLCIVLSISVITHRCQCRCLFSFDTNENDRPTEFEVCPTSVFHPCYPRKLQWTKLWVVKIWWDLRH